MRWIARGSLLAGLAACVVLPEEEFLTKYPREMCGRAQACLWDVPADIDVCRESYLDGLDQITVCIDQVPIYIESAAKDCISEVRGLQCESSIHENPLTPPASCQLVYDCPATAGSL